LRAIDKVLLRNVVPLNNILRRTKGGSLPCDAPPLLQNFKDSIFRSLELPKSCPLNLLATLASNRDGLLGADGARLESTKGLRLPHHGASAYPSQAVGERQAVVFIQAAR